MAYSEKVVDHFNNPRNMGSFKKEEDGVGTGIVGAPECGDGYHCDGEGICRESTGQPGDSCTSETDCSVGLSCQLNRATATDERNRLLATCSEQKQGRPAGAACNLDGDCRNGT